MRCGRRCACLSVCGLWIRARANARERDGDMWMWWRWWRSYAYINSNANNESGNLLTRCALAHRNSTKNWKWVWFGVNVQIYPYLLQITSHSLWLIYRRALNTVFKLDYCGQPVWCACVCVRSSPHTTKLNPSMAFRCRDLFLNIFDFSFVVPVASMRSQRPTYC